MLVFFAQVLFQRRPAFADVEDLPSAYARLRDGAELQHFRPDFRRVCTIFCPDSHRANWLEAGAELLHDGNGALKPCGACYAATQFKDLNFQLVTSWQADYPIFWSEADIQRVIACSESCFGLRLHLFPPISACRLTPKVFRIGFSEQRINCRARAARARNIVPLQPLGAGVSAEAPLLFFGRDDRSGGAAVEYVLPG